MPGKPFKILKTSWQGFRLTDFWGEDVDLLENVTCPIQFLCHVADISQYFCSWNTRRLSVVILNICQPSPHGMLRTPQLVLENPIG